VGAEVATGRRVDIEDEVGVDVDEDVDDAATDDGDRQRQLHERPVRLALPPPGALELGASGGLLVVRRVVERRQGRVDEAVAALDRARLTLGRCRGRVQHVRHRPSILPLPSSACAVTGAVPGLSESGRG
jgi:hypothetical protein